MFIYRSICLPTVNFEKKNDIEMDYKKYARKWRFEGDSVTLICRRQ